MSTLVLPHIDLERPRRVFVAMVGLILFSAAARGTADAEGGSGCDERLAHVGCAGAVGGGGILARVVSKGADDALRVGGEAAQVGLARGGSQVVKGLDGGAVHAVALDTHWDEAAEVVGRMASGDGHLATLPDLVARHPSIAGLQGDELLRYAEANPGFWKDAGVELYLRDPHLWTELGGDELLSLAAVRSPAMREAVGEVAVGRMKAAAGELEALDVADRAAVTAFEGKWGVRLLVEAGKQGLQVVGPDYTYELADVEGGIELERVVEKPVSERARFGPEQAKAELEAAVEGIAVREAKLDVPGLYAFRRKVPGVREIPVHWLGPGVHLTSSEPADFDRLVGLVGADEGEGIDPDGFAALWTGFHLDLFASVCAPDRFDTHVAPPSVELGEGITYRFATREGGGPCLEREIGFEGEKPRGG